MQLLNALFPPYLVSFPVPCIDVKEIRTVRENIYIALLNAEARFGGGDGKARAEAFQNDLLTQIGIGSWPAEIWPALSGYLALVESVKVLYGEVFSSQKETGLDMSETPALIFKEERLCSRSDSATELSQVGVKSIFKNSLSSVSGQSFSTYASSYSFASEPVMHGMAKLDEQELIRMGLSSPSSSSHRSGQTSFDSSKSSPLELTSASFRNTSAAKFCAASIQNAQPVVQNLGFPDTSQATAVVNSEDDVFAAKSSLHAFEEDEEINQDCQEPKLEQNGEHSDQLNTVAFPPLPVLEAKKSTMPPKRQSAQQTPITTSERTRRLIKSGWKSTETLFSKFRAYEQVSGGVPTIPHMPLDRLSSFSQRRPSKSVRFSDVQRREENNTICLENFQEFANDTKDMGIYDATQITKYLQQQQTDKFARPDDPWQYARDYLIEKVKARQEGRRCALRSPLPEWFSEMDCASSRQSIFSSKFGRDTIAKLVSDPGGCNGRAMSLLDTKLENDNASLQTAISLAPGFGEIPTKDFWQENAAPQQLAVGA